MKLKENLQKLNMEPLNQEVFNEDTLNWIAKENLWNLWIPKSHGGLEMSLGKGLEKLRSLAQMDGSLGWTITLCSGANFFFGNLKKQVVDAIFLDTNATACFGGSGGVFGIAEKKEDGYLISGTWKYATGAPYLTHFTLNATIYEKGNPVLHADGSAIVRSFVVDKDKVEIIPDWNTMGLKATATHSFEVKEKWVPRGYSFIYNELFHDQPIFKVPFAVFADLTLWVNYIGMAAHFFEEAQQVIADRKVLNDLVFTVEKSDAEVKKYALEVENDIKLGNSFPESKIDEIHQKASNCVKSLSEAIIKIYPLLGIRACSENHKLNHIFRDYFTATQHYIFSRKKV